MNLPIYIKYYKHGWAWGFIKWRYFGKSSWKHGTAYLGKIKICW